MSLQTVPLLGYAPDLDPTTPGVFSYCFGMEPTSRGWKLQRALTTGGATGASGGPIDGAVSYNANVTGATVPIIHVAFGTHIWYTPAGAGLFDVSRSGNYAAISDPYDGYTFCQYGNTAIVARLGVAVGTRDATTTNVFVDSTATGIPKAAICVTWGPPTSPRVMLLNYNDGTAYPDGWWTSHQGGPTLAWTPDIATGAANGRLLGAGPIRCAVSYRDDVIAFGERSMWKGIFVGPPYVIEWQQISSELGCVSPYAAKVANGILYFLGQQGLYQFDGSYPRKMPLPIQSQITASASTSPRSKIAYDEIGQRLIVSMRSDAASNVIQAATRVYIINLLTNKVGIDGRASWLVLDKNFYATTGVVEYEALTPYQATLGSLFGIGLHYIGDNHKDTLLTGVYPRFITPPTTFSSNDYFGPTASEILSNNIGATTYSATPWRHDFLKSARWHAPRLLFSSSGADVEIADVMINSERAGAA